MGKENNNNNSNINIKKKYFVISIVLVSFLSIILLTTSIVSLLTSNNNNVLAVDAQKEQPLKSPSQLQAEQQKQQQQQQQQDSQLLSSQKTSSTLVSSCTEQKTKCEKDALELEEVMFANCEGPMGDERKVVGQCKAQAILLFYQTLRQCDKAYNDCNCNWTCQAGEICQGPAGAKKCVCPASQQCGASSCCPKGQTCNNGSCGFCPIGTTMDPGTGECLCPDRNQALNDQNQCADKCGNGPPCPTGQTCNNGSCGFCPIGTTMDPGTGECLCPDRNQEFVNGQCVDKCPTDTTRDPTTGQCNCPTSQTFCDQRCIDTNTDNNNCGACSTATENHACTGGQTCQSGTCQCPLGQVFQNGQCQLETCQKETQKNIQTSTCKDTTCSWLNCGANYFAVKDYTGACGCLADSCGYQMSPPALLCGDALADALK